MSSKSWLMVLTVMVIAIVGCRREEEAKTPLTSSEDAIVSPAEPSDSVRQLQPADQQDDPQYALLFPRSDQVDGWIKTKPVKGANASNISELLPDLADVLTPYAVDSITTATYQRRAGNVLENIDVYLLRSSNGDDAYGMMSVSSPGKDIVRGSQIRRYPTRTQLVAVKGPYFILFRAETFGDDVENLIDGLEQLAGKMLFGIPESAEIPMVAHILQGEKLSPSTVLFLRDLRSMKGPAGQRVLEQIGLEDLEQMNQLLGLGPNVDFAVGIYTSEDWIGPNVVWVVKYPNREKAMEIAGIYSNIISRATAQEPLHYQSLLKEPRGSFLLGTWTIDAEALAHLMNTVQTFLP